MKNQIQYFEKNRYGMMSFYLVLVSCLGSIAVMEVLKVSDSIVLLSLAAGITMASNSACIAQASAKSCVYIFYVALVVNVTIIISQLIIA